MTDTKNILSFLGIPEKEIKNISIEYENEEAYVIIGLKDIRDHHKIGNMKLLML